MSSRTAWSPGERTKGDAQCGEGGWYSQRPGSACGVEGVQASCCFPSVWVGGEGSAVQLSAAWEVAGGEGRGSSPRPPRPTGLPASRHGALPSQAAGRPASGWAGGDGGALILTGAARLWNEGRRRPPARPVRSVLGPERSRAQRARPRQRSGAREGGGARRSQRPDMPRTRGRCTPAAARSQPARRPHARVPPRRAARGLRPGPSARGQQ